MRSKPTPRDERRTPIGGYRLTLAVLIAVAVLAALGAVAVHRNSSSSSSSLGRVAVVGDSITVLASRDITVALGGTEHTDIRAEFGQRIDQMLPALSSLLAEHPAAVVVNLGTNDALQAPTHPDWHNGFEHLIAMLAPSDCVLLTTISTLLDRPPPTPPVAAEIDDAITSVTLRRHNFHVVDWNKEVHGRNGITLLSSDRIHPSPAGQIALAALIRTALRHDCHIG